MDTKTFYIYKISNLVNGKLYIGQTDDPKRRWNEHLYVSSAGKEKAKNKFLAINAAIVKYGADNFKMDIIDLTDLEEKIDQLEVNWIAQLKESGYELYNADIGGKVLRGKNHHMYGKRHTDATKKLIGEKSKGRESFWKGKRLPETARQKISAIRIANKIGVGEDNPSAKLTAKMVEEIKILVDTKTYKEVAAIYHIGVRTIDKIKNGTFNVEKSRKLTPVQLEEINILINHPTIKEIAEKYGVDESTIHRIKSGKLWK
jgi:group I intron endonuclease